MSESSAAQLCSELGNKLWAKLQELISWKCAQSFYTGWIITYNRKQWPDDTKNAMFFLLQLEEMNESVLVSWLRGSQGSRPCGSHWLRGSRLCGSHQLPTHSGDPGLVDPTSYRYTPGIQALWTPLASNALLGSRLSGSHRLRQTWHGG